MCIRDRGSEFQYNQSLIGDFKFVILDSFLSFDNKMPFWKNFIMKSYYNLKRLSVKEEVNFGLDKSHLLIEKYPLVVVPYQGSILTRKQAHNKNVH